MSVVTFLTDYGLRDDVVGVCHGVIARIVPRARILARVLAADRYGNVGASGLRLGGRVEVNGRRARYPATFAAEVRIEAAT